MARQAGYALLGALCIMACVVAVHSATVGVSSKSFVGTHSVDANSTTGGAGAHAQVASAALKLLASKVNSTMGGLQSALGVVLRGAGVTPAVYDALTGPLIDQTTKMLNSMTVVRDAYETSLKGFFGLLLDNTKELRRTLEDGNAIIDTVRTLRGAKCEEASFDPPTQKPARITGPAGLFKITTGSCTLKRVATPLKLDFVLDCNEPGVAVDIKVPRYTSRYVSAAKAVTEECKVTRKYGVESETTVTLFNAADFFATAEGASAISAAGVQVQGGNTTTADPSGSPLGANRAAGWAGTLFPALGKHKLLKKKGSLLFMPQDIAAKVKQAIRQSTVDMAVSYKPFTIRSDMLQSADSVVQALAQTFEVKQQLFKVYKDDLSGWANATQRAETLKDINFGSNLRESMAKMNMTTLFDGLFASTASKLMAKTKLGGVLGSKVGSKLGGVAESLSSERPLRTLLSKVRQGAGHPIDLSLETSLDGALGSLSSLAAGSGALSKLLSGPFKKGSLMELLAKDKASVAHMQELTQLLGSFASMDLGGGGVQQPAAQQKSAAVPDTQPTKSAADGAAEGAGNKSTSDAAATNGGDGDGDSDAGNAGEPEANNSQAAGNSSP